MNKALPIVLGVTGASGAVYGLGLLEFLLANDFQVELVYSDSAKLVAYHELGYDFRNTNKHEFKTMLYRLIHQRKEIASPSAHNDNSYENNLRIWDHSDVAASISSGSYKTQGMIIAPASMGTIANIAAGTSNNLIARAADVVLKERRKLVLVARETPLSTIHLRNMLTLSEMGAIVLPAAPGFYQHPKTIEDQVNFVLGKTLDAFGLDHELFTRWMNPGHCEERSDEAISKI
jgi:4-hydroxy-3-polyprenylbenzoate decarboxylase